tara:strand:- start:3404 stop:3556 length:153 start_codon:yes stop_codon:yes gene_type:complete
MNLWEVIEDLKHAIEEEDWDLVSDCTQRLENIHQETEEDDLNEYFQGEEY